MVGIIILIVLIILSIITVALSMTSYFRYIGMYKYYRMLCRKESERPHSEDIEKSEK